MSNFNPYDLSLPPVNYGMSSAALPPISQEFVRPSLRETRRPATSAGILQRQSGQNGSFPILSADSGFGQGVNTGLGATLASGLDPSTLSGTQVNATATPNSTTTATATVTPSPSSGPTQQQQQQLQQQHLHQQQRQHQHQQQQQAKMMMMHAMARRTSDNDFSGVFAHTVDGPNLTSNSHTNSSSANFVVDPADFRRHSGGTYSSGQMHPAMEAYLASATRTITPTSVNRGPNARPTTSSGIMMQNSPMGAAAGYSRPPTAGGILNRPGKPPGSAGKGSVRFDAPLAPHPPSSQQQQTLAPGRNITQTHQAVPMSHQPSSNGSDHLPATLLNNRRKSEPFSKHVASQINLPSHAKLYQDLGLSSLLAAQNQPPFVFNNQSPFQDFRISPTDTDAFSQKTPIFAYNPVAPAVTADSASLNGSGTNGNVSVNSHGLNNGYSSDPVIGLVTDPRGSSLSQSSYQIFDAVGAPISNAYPQFAADYKFGDAPPQSTTATTGVPASGPVMQTGRSDASFASSIMLPDNSFGARVPEGELMCGMDSWVSRGSVLNIFNISLVSSFFFLFLLFFPSFPLPPSPPWTSTPYHASARNNSTSTTSSRHPGGYDLSRDSISSDVAFGDYRKDSSEYGASVGIGGGGHGINSGQPESSSDPNMSGGEGTFNYSHDPSSGPMHKKRPRRKFDQIERLYLCGFEGCEKSYGTLNHLNAHVYMQKHGVKRRPEEFKEIRKAWRKRKKEEARMAAEGNMANANVNGLFHNGKNGNKANNVNMNGNGNRSGILNGDKLNGVTNGGGLQHQSHPSHHHPSRPLNHHANQNQNQNQPISHLVTLPGPPPPSSYIQTHAHHTHAAPAHVHPAGYYHPQSQSIPQQAPTTFPSSWQEQTQWLAH